MKGELKLDYRDEACNNNNNNQSNRGTTRREYRRYIQVYGISENWLRPK
jgi:hypothetical protein